MKASTYSLASLAALLPYPKEDMNKYTRGRLMCALGSAQYPGAACLGARAGEYMGAGYTHVITEASVAPYIHAAAPSIVVTAWDDIDPASLPAATEGHPCAYDVGSGYDATDAMAKIRTRLILENAHAPVLLDGGSLDVACGQKIRDILADRASEGLINVFTPHQGEAARMAAPLGIATDDQATLAFELAKAYCGTVMVKGAKTYISDGESLVLMDQGTQALAKAGTGDVLAGMTASLLAQGLAPLDACVLASTLHVFAGRIAAERLSNICVRAEDVLAAIPRAIYKLEQERADA